MSTDPAPRSQPRPGQLTPAHVPLILLGALLILAVALGMAAGIVGPGMLHQPVPSPSDAITIP